MFVRTYRVVGRVIFLRRNYTCQRAINLAEPVIDFQTRHDDNIFSRINLDRVNWDRRVLLKTCMNSRYLFN